MTGVQFGGDEVVQAKGGAGSATLSMAYAGYRLALLSVSSIAWVILTIRNRFTESIIKAAKGEKGIVEPTFVYLPGVVGGEAIAKETGVDFFSVPIELGVSRDLRCILLTS